MADVTRLKPVLKLVVLVAIILTGFLLKQLTPVGEYLSAEGIGRVVEELRGMPAAPFIYIGIYIAATALAFPGSLLTLVGGAVFGVLWGSVFTTIGANIGASLAFLLARGLGREGVERLAGSRLAGLDRATVHHGFVGHKKVKGNGRIRINIDALVHHLSVHRHRKTFAQRMSIGQTKDHIVGLKITLNQAGIVLTPSLDSI